MYMVFMIITRNVYEFNIFAEERWIEGLIYYLVLRGWMSEVYMIERGEMGYAKSGNIKLKLEDQKYLSNGN